MSTDYDPTENDRSTNEDHAGDDIPADSDGAGTRSETEGGDEDATEQSIGLFEQFHRALTGQPTEPDRRETAEPTPEDEDAIEAGNGSRDRTVSDERRSDGYPHESTDENGGQASAGTTAPGDSTWANGEITGDPTPDGVAESLASELESGSVDDEVIATLNEHLAQSLDRSAMIRLQRVESRVSELEAYIDALEPLINRSGTGEDIATLLDNLEQRLAELEEDRVSQKDVADIRAEIESVQDQVQTIYEMGRYMSDVFDE